MTGLDSSTGLIWQTICWHCCWHRLYRVFVQQKRTVIYCNKEIKNSKNELRTWEALELGSFTPDFFYPKKIWETPAKKKKKANKTWGRAEVQLGLGLVFCFGAGLHSAGRKCSLDPGVWQDLGTAAGASNGLGAAKSISWCHIPELYWVQKWC